LNFTEQQNVQPEPDPLTPDEAPEADGNLSMAEQEERATLARVKKQLHRAIEEMDARVQRYARDVREQKTYLTEHKAGMDHVEKVSTRQSIQQTIMSGEKFAEYRARLQKLRFSPYFGRVDFIPEGKQQPEKIYIGIHHFRDEEGDANLIYDWRAPISTIFYDHETGPVHYESPSGQVRGEMPLKRQFRIRNGQMELMLESSVHIVDDVLQKELSRASDEGMKNIVATIQRDQNAIVRNEDAHVLVIQGVAGSGKTSIALHRIAFLLYRFKETLKSQDILIISPNRVFADYISNVLPELGEESVTEMGMETLANELLDYRFKFQTFFEQTALLLEKDDEEMKRRIRVKASPDFLQQINTYAGVVEKQFFSVEDLHVGSRLIPASLIEETFKKQRGLPPAEQIRRVVSAIEQHVGIYYNYDVSTQERTELRDAVRKMIRRPSLREIYRKLFEWMGDPDLFKLAPGGKLEYADVFPLIYLKMRLEGVDTPHRNIKHLLIDEMQDYTPVQYAVIALLFRCKKTILGDATQSVNPYSASTAETIQRTLGKATCVKLTRSYRSSFEIMQFAQHISPNPELIPIARHGEAPQVILCRNKADEIAQICSQIAAFSASPYHTMGIICRTQKQAEALFQSIVSAGFDAELFSAESASFSRGIVVCTAHMAKGLEFDRVIVPNVSEKNYSTEMDRNMLYVACTRAMHLLTLTCVGTPSRFLLH
jgi:DNA helicase-2/ATP-dependent DNA helicase PcrA